MKVDYVARARAEIARAWEVYKEMMECGRTAARTNRLRRAKDRAVVYLRRAIWARQIDEGGARAIYESAPPDPEFGPERWRR